LGVPVGEADAPGVPVADDEDVAVADVVAVGVSEGAGDVAGAAAWVAGAVGASDVYSGFSPVWTVTGTETSPCVAKSNVTVCHEPGASDDAPEKVIVGWFAAPAMYSAFPV